MPQVGPPLRSFALWCMFLACAIGEHSAAYASSPLSRPEALEKQKAHWPGLAPRQKAALATELCEAWTEAIEGLKQGAPPIASRGTPPRAPLGPAEAAQQAVKAGREAIALDPSSPRARTALAVALGKMTDYVDNSTKLALSREIRTEAEAALALAPEDELAHHILGRWNYSFATLNPMLKAAARLVYGKLPDASLDAAQRHLEKAIAANPSRLTSHHCLALVHTTTKAKADAEPHWRAVLSLPAQDDEDREAQAQARKALGLKK